MLVRKPKILFYDIETLPYIGVFWATGQQYLGPNQILTNRSVICVSYNWLGENKVSTVSIGDDQPMFKKNPYYDKEVLRKFYEVMKSADIIVAHNGDSFDCKILMARFMEEGFPPLPQMVSVDTLKAARKTFKFTSNKLDYLGKYLGVGRKIDMNLDVWLRIIAKDPVALARMERYNKQDVRLLKDVYLKLLPYIRNHPNVGLITDSEVDCCPNCGSTKLQKRGFSYTKVAKYQRYQCKDCSAWRTGTSNLRRKTA